MDFLTGNSCVDRCRQSSGSARKNNEPINGYLTPDIRSALLPLLAAKEWEFFTANGFDTELTLMQ